MGPCWRHCQSRWRCLTAFKIQFIASPTLVCLFPPPPLWVIQLFIFFSNNNKLLLLLLFLQLGLKVSTSPGWGLEKPTKSRSRLLLLLLLSFYELFLLLRDKQIIIINNYYNKYNND